MTNPAKFIIIRGLPGSGKSTLAASLERKFNHYNFEADNFFEHINSTGDTEYNFNHDLLEYAHAQCKGNVAYFLSHGGNVIVSNTTINWSQTWVYLKIAKQLNIDKVDIVECSGAYGDIHNVPVETYKSMQRNWLSNKQISELDFLSEFVNSKVTFYTDEEYKKLMEI